MSSWLACPQAAPHACRYKRLRALVIAVGVIVICALEGSAVYDAWRSYTRSIEQTHRELGNLARALAEQGARSVQTIDVVVRDTAHWYSEVGYQMPRDAIEAALANRAAGLPQVHLLTIADAEGVQRHGDQVVLAHDHAQLDELLLVPSVGQLLPRRVGDRAADPARLLRS